MMKYRKFKIFAIVAAAVLCVVTVGAGIAVDSAKEEKHKYIRSSQEMAINDLADAAKMLEKAVRTGDKEAAFRAAGMAEAYLSRSGLDNCGALYTVIVSICTGEYGIDICEELALAAKEALNGDGGAALRALAKRSEPISYVPETTAEDTLSERVLKRIGRGSDEVAKKKATAFCCPNAVFERCESEIPSSFKYSGENIFIALEGKRPHVTMYCFDRDLNENHTVTYEDAAHTVELLVKKEKLKLADEPLQTFEDGIYCFTYLTKDGEKLVSIEIYSDTGRLRKFDAVNYYASIN